MKDAINRVFDRGPRHWRRQTTSTSKSREATGNQGQIGCWHRIVAARSFVSYPFQSPCVLVPLLCRPSGGPECRGGYQQMKGLVAVARAKVSGGENRPSFHRDRKLLRPTRGSNVSSGALTPAPSFPPGNSHRSSLSVITRSCLTNLSGGKVFLQAPREWIHQFPGYLLRTVTFPPVYSHLDCFFFGIRMLFFQGLRRWDAQIVAIFLQMRGPTRVVIHLPFFPPNELRRIARRSIFSNIISLADGVVFGVKPSLQLTDSFPRRILQNSQEPQQETSSARKLFEESFQGPLDGQFTRRL